MDDRRILCIVFRLYKLNKDEMGKFQKFLEYKYNYLKIVHYDVQINLEVEESLLDYLDTFVSSLATLNY